VATLGNPKLWSPVQFRVALKSAHGEKTFFRETVDLPQRNQWLDRTVDLATWAESEALVIFEVQTETSDPSSVDPVYPLWANPVLYSKQDSIERPSIILISVDCLRPDHMGLYGYERDTTPQIDALARDGVVFREATASSSWTLPSHMSMLTGLTPSFHAVSRQRKLAPSVAYLPELLSEAGYEVDGVVSGAYLSPNFGFERGFHHYRVLKRPRASQTVDEAVELLERARGRDFFFFLHLIDPHWRYLPPEDFVERFGPRPPDLDALLNRVIEREPPSSRQDIKHLQNLYDGEIAYVDQELGRLFDWLKAQELYEPSLIILTSDHGEAFYEHEYWQHSDTLYEEMIRVPLIVKKPGGSSHRGVEAPVSHVDIFATILEAAGLPPPTSQGRSLTRRTGTTDGDKTISEVIWWGDENTRKKVSLRSENLKYIASFELAAQDDLTIHKMLQEELYDLSADPEERNNLETSRHMAAFRKELDALLEEAKKFRADHEKGGRVVIDDEVRERLRALGYIQ
jgi:arylsulfatase A-like enzyme